MSLKINNLINLDGNIYNPSNLLNSTNQTNYLITDNFSSNIFNWMSIDKNDINDSTNIVSTFNIASNSFTITQNNANSYLNTGISNKYIHGRNKFIQFVCQSGMANNPIVFSRYTNSNNTALSYFDANNQRLHVRTLISGVETTVQDFVYDGGNNPASIVVPNYASNKVYQWTIKSFENMIFTALVDKSNDSLVRHFSHVETTRFINLSGNRNGLGLNNNPSTTNVVLTDFKCKDIHNFINVVCIGDSNTAGDWSSTIRDSGKSYVQLLNQKYLDKNIVFTNSGISGMDTANLLSFIQNLGLNYYVQGARNIATILIGTNDAGEVSASWNFTNTQNNYNNIISRLKQAGFEVWLMTYPPRNQNETPNAGTTPSQTVMNTHNLRVSQINGFIRSLNGVVDRIIPLDLLFTDPSATVNISGTIYNNSYSTYVGLGNTSQTGYIHFTPLGNSVIANALSNAIDESWYDSQNLKTLTLTKRLTIEGERFNNFTNTNGGNVSVGNGSLNVDGQVILSGTNTSQALNNSLFFSQSGLALPSTGSRSLGTRMVLFPSLSPSVTDFSIGINGGGGPGCIWYNVADLTDEHRFYHNTTLGLQMSSTLATFNQRINVTNNTQSTSFVSGSITTAGGLGVAKNVQIGEDLRVTGNTTLGGLGVSGNTNVGGSLAVTGSSTLSGGITSSGILNVSNNTQSTSTTTGSITTLGGLGVSGNTNVGGSLAASGNTTIAGQVSITNSTPANALGLGALVVSGGTSIGASLRVRESILVGSSGNTFNVIPAGGGLTLNQVSPLPASHTTSVSGNIVTNGGITSTNDTNATSVNAGGGLAIKGGAAIGRKLFVGEELTVVSSTQSTSVTTGSITTSGGIGVAKNVVIGTSGSLANLILNGTTAEYNATISVNASGTGTFPGSYAFYTSNATSGVNTGTGPAVISLYTAGRILISGEVDILSDQREKKDIEQLPSSLNLIQQLNPVKYKKTDHLLHGHNQTAGLLAQEVKNIIPESVTCNKGVVANIMKKCIVKEGMLDNPLPDGKYKFIVHFDKHEIHEVIDSKVDLPDGEHFVYGQEVPDVHKLNYISLIPYLIKSIQELNEKIEHLK